MRGCRRHRPSDPHCPICAGRYARRVARSIVASKPRNLAAVEFKTDLDIGEFDPFRVAVRNLIDFQRRECRWWRDFRLWGWLSSDGHVRGVAALDALQPDEFVDAFLRWPMSVRRIGVEEVEAAVVAAVRPGVIASAGRGYQQVKLVIGPKGVARVAAPVISVQRRVIEPMPVLVG